MTEVEAIEAAKGYLARIFDDYPMMPLDDFGNVDEDAWEPGRTPWNILEKFIICNAEITDRDKDDYTVQVELEWKWSEDEEAEDDVCFEVYVPLDSQPDWEFDYDRIQ